METPATVAAIRSAAKPAARLTPGAASGARTPVSGKSAVRCPPGSFLSHTLGHRAGSAMGGQVVALQNQLTEMRESMEGLEKERDFYFAKVSLDR
jgi:RP/EB family microtubule-associated protein